MCGIAGELVLSGAAPPPDREAVARMSAALVHRGPDDAGLHVEGPVALASRRLAILDLSPAGHMPMVNPASGLVLVYNGEIYNSPELRRELEARGERLRSSGDSEVVLRLLARDGPRALPRLRGMFAFACWDPRTHTLLLARDLWGVKPLYLHRSAERLLFASEIRGLLAHPATPRRLSRAGLADYFTLGHTVTPHTMYDEIEKLPAGTWLAIGTGGSARGVLAGTSGVSGVGAGEPGATAPAPVVWGDPLDLLPASPPPPASEPELAAELLATLRDSVVAHLLADVPLGVFLSGGVDSSAVVALLARAGVRDLRTFSVGFRGPAALNELPEARLVARAFGTRHEELVLGEEDLAATVVPLVRHLDEPPGDAACFPTFALARAAAGSVKVVLTGEGGDEMFGGYRRYAADRLGRWYRGPVRAAAEPLLAAAHRLFPGVARVRRTLGALAIDDPAERGLAWQWVNAPAEVAELLEPAWTGDLGRPVAAYRAHYERGAARLDRLGALLYADQKVRMSDGYCEKIDRATMAASLEARVPFIDTGVGRFAARLPSGLKVRGTQLKVLLRRALRGLVPDAVLDHAKRGFTVPLRPWFRGALRPLVAEVLDPAAVARRGILRPDAVRRLLASEDADTEARLWLAFAFELWCREHLPDADGSGGAPHAPARSLG